MNSCKLCNASPLVTKHLLNGKLSIDDVMIEYHMTEEEIMDHLNTHQIERIQPPRINDSLKRLNPNPTQDEITAYLYNLINELQNWIEWMQENEEMDKSTIEMLLKIVDRIMKGVDSAAKIQGIISDGVNYQTNYVQVQGDMKMLTNVITNQLCDHCKMKVLDVMENQKLLK